MTWLVPQPEAIPHELRSRPWVLWRAEPRGPRQKPAKVPYCVAEPLRRASSTDPATWATFTDAVDAYSALADLPPDPQRGPIAGLSVVLTADGRVTCIDLDRVIDDDGQLDLRAQTIVDCCDSWTEVSPSGRGLHVYVRGTVPRALRGDHIEVYSAGRVIAVTGRRWPGTPDELRDQQAYLDHLARVAGAGPVRTTAGPAGPPPDDLATALLKKLADLGVTAGRPKRWGDGYLVELPECPWAAEHTTGPGGAAVIIHASGAYDYTCLHAHCAHRGWRDFRAVMEARA